MPTYVYEVILDDGEEGQVFEVFQKMSDPPLTHHPVTGQPVRRVFQPPNVVSTYSDKHMKKQVSDDKKLDKLGFTKYVKAGGGYYEKRAGRGPDVISKDD